MNKQRWKNWQRTLLDDLAGGGPQHEKILNTVEQTPEISIFFIGVGISRPPHPFKLDCTGPRVTNMSAARLLPFFFFFFFISFSFSSSFSFSFSFFFSFIIFHFLLLFVFFLFLFWFFFFFFLSLSFSRLVFLFRFFFWNKYWGKKK